MKIILIIAIAVGCFAASCTPKNTTNGMAATGEQNSAHSLYGQDWQLVELAGKLLSDSGGRQPFLHFDSIQASMNGFAGCNNFRGRCEAKAGNRLSFSGIAATRMACPDISTETALLQVLEKTDNYTIADGMLSLNKARMAPLARFKAVAQK